MKKLFIYLLSLCAIVSCLQEERSPEEILVPSPAQVECSDASSLLLTSKVPKKSENLVDECGFYYSTDESMAHAVKVEASMDVNNFAAELPERNYGTTYYICSYVTNGHGSEIRSEVSSYNLKALDKYIQFEPIELLSYNKAETSAEVTFEVEIWSGVNVSEIGVCFGVTTSPSTEGRHVKGNLTDDGLVLASLPNFLTDKEYYLRAYVRDGDYTAYGEITPLTIKLFPPTLSSVIVSSVKSSSATFSSAVTDDGGDKITEVGFYYSTDESVDPETSFKVNQVYTSESFSLESTNLQANTNYYVKSFAVNSVGVAYSEVASFMTAPGAPQVATLEATDVTESSAVLSGNIISDNGAKITERGFVWLKGMDVPTVESNKLKAEGTTGEFTAILSDIEPNQKYSFRAYAINSEGTTYGDVMTFSTSVAMPVLAAVEVSNVTSTSATFSSKVLDHGGSTVTDVGFYYSTQSEVDPSTSVDVSRKYANDAFSIDVTELQIFTKYYVKAYTKNAAGTAYSEVMSFTTNASTPVVNTIGSSDVTAESVKLSGTVVTDNGAKITERGFVWLLGEGSPTLSAQKEVVDGTTGDFTVSLNGLSPNQKYSFRAYATNAKGTTYGAVMTFSTVKGLPSVSAATVSNITSTSATFSGKVESHGGETVSDVGFYYNTDPDVNEGNSTKVELKYSNDDFSVNVSDLAVFTKYYVRTYVKNSVGISYGTIVSFTTDSSSPVVTTVGSSDITSSSATLSGAVVTDNGASITERGFVWVKGTDAPTTSSNKVKVEGTTGEFTTTMSDLEANQKYSFRAYAINSKGTAYGDVMTFTTSITNASLSSVIVSDITSTSATLSSKVSGHGGETVSEVGFYYSTEETVDPAKSQKVNRTYSSDSFSISISGLSINTKYYVKAYAVNSAGTVYSEIESFTTLASTPVVNTTGSSEVTSDSAVLTGKVVTDNGAAITERGFVWLKGSDAPTTSSNKVKVEGTIGDFTATLSDLEPNQKYSFRAYAVNSVGTSYGDVMYFTTVAGRPTLSVTKVTDITETSATFTSKVTSDGGSTPTEVGFYYSKEESVNVETAQKVSEAFSSDNFTLSVSDLEVGTSYYVKAFALNSTGEAYNDIVSFKTVSTAPSVQTTDASDISSSGAMLSGEVLDDNGEPISERGFVWIKGQGTPAASSNKVNVDGTTGEYSATISGLEPNQTYSYRAYAANSKGTAYGETKSFVTLVALPEVEYLSASDITSSSAVVTAKVTAHGGETVSEVGFLYGTTSSIDPSTASRVTSAYNIDSFSFTLDNLSRATEYYVRPFATNSAGTSYGETMSFTTLPELPVVSTMDVIEITDNSAVCGGVITDDGNGEIIAKGVVWSRSKNPTAESFFKTEEGSGKSSYTSYLTDLTPGSTYYVRAYAVNAAGISYGEELVFTTTGEALYQVLESANCFIVSESGTYSFKTVKGNSLESVGSVASAEVLWESFGTDEVPDEGSLVSSVSLQGDAIVFDVADPYREGNAVIAAKDASGTVLWSWHIWLTDQPEEHVYNNNAGTMMDRNLGATSATPGDVGALCLLYQWGRKDPFLSGSTINSWGQEAKSTITWPPSVSSNSSTGTIDYAISNPTTYIKYNSNNRDWYYTGTSDTDNTRWTTSERGKSIYDPCPAGWRVPDGGSEGIWSKAGFSGTTFDRTNKGISFSINSPSTTWYPASGFRSYSSGALSDVGQYGHYWSATPINNAAYYLYFYNGSVYPSNSSQRADGFAVRCIQE